METNYLLAEFYRIVKRLLYESSEEIGTTISRGKKDFFFSFYGAQKLKQKKLADVSTF